MARQTLKSHRRAEALVYGLGLLVVFAAYWPAVHAGFIWDDDAHVTGNATLRSVEGLRRIWTDPTSLPQYYPLVHTSFWVEYHLWKVDPLGFHVVNIFLHATNAFLLWRVLRLLAIPGALFAATLFAVHPVEVESVAWVTERKNLLSTFFYLTALLAYLRFRSFDRPRLPQSPRWRWYAVCVGCFLCALFGKTVACSLPAAILLLHWWQHGRLEKRDVLYTAPLFLLGVAFAVHTAALELNHVGARGDEWAWSAVERLLIAGRAVWFYAGKLLWPANLTFIYPQWSISATAWWQYLFPCAAVVTVALAWLWRHRIGRGPVVSLLFFGGTLVPALGVVNLYPMRYSFVADHFQYVASIGLLTLFASFAVLCIARLPAFWRNVGYAACGLVVLLLAVQTNRQSRIYESSVTLWEDTLEKNPGCWMAHGNLGTVLASQGDVVRAAPHFQKATDHYLAVARARPLSARARHNLGSALLRQGRHREAIDQFKTAVQLDPDDFSSRDYLGVMLAQQGRIDEALTHLRDALRAKPTFAPAHFNLANVLFKQGRIAEAETHYREALRLKPFDGEAHNNLGLLLFDEGRKAEAAQGFLKAIELTPDNIPARHNLAMVRASERKYADALFLFKEIARLNPEDREAREQIAELERMIREGATD